MYSARRIVCMYVCIYRRKDDCRSHEFHTIRLYMYVSMITSMYCRPWFTSGANVSTWQPRTAQPTMEGM